jgi:molybdenum cofactor cytidylyltransferase
LILLPTVIVLAAGKGERFIASGAHEDKLNADLCGQRVRDHVLSAVQASGLPFHTVEREHTQHLLNPGMADSIACGIKATLGSRGWLILPADLPLIQPQTLRKVAEALSTHSIVVPCYRGKKGHPVGFQESHKDSLIQLSGDEGARAVVSAHTYLALEVEDQGVVCDVDTLELLEEARVRMQNSNFQVDRTR